MDDLFSKPSSELDLYYNLISFYLIYFHSKNQFYIFKIYYKKKKKKKKKN